MPYVPSGSGSGGTVKWFADAAARDAYYTSNPNELKAGISVGIGNPVVAWTYDGTQWITGALAFKGDKGDKGDTGAPGAAGTNGTDGQDGEGVPTGGSTGQILSKQSSADFDTEWVDNEGGLPTGGGVGQVLSKKTVADFDTEWITPSGTFIDAPTDGKTYGRNSGTWEEVTTDGVTLVDVDGTETLIAVDNTDTQEPVIGSTTALQTAVDAANSAYQKPSAGIPKSDLTTALQGSVDLADAALQPSDVVNDLTTGGTAVPLSAEQGKTLKSSVDGKVSLVSATTQIIDSDIALDHDSSLLGTDTNGTEHTLISHNEYAGGQQTEVGSEVDALCINYNAKGWDGTVQPQGNRPLVNFKDTTGASKADSLVLYNENFVPLSNQVASLAMGGIKIGSFADKASVPTVPSDAGWLKVPTENDFYTVQSDEDEGGSRTQYYVTAVDIANDTMSVAIDGVFTTITPDILITDFSGTALVPVVPADGQSYEIYWAAATTSAPDVGAGFGTIQRVGTDYIITAGTATGVYHGTATTTANPVWNKLAKNSDIPDVSGFADKTSDFVTPVISTNKGLTESELAAHETANDAEFLTKEPVITRITPEELAAMELDPTLAEDGVKYFVPDTNAGETLFQCVPNYSAMETTNRISTNNGTWTADRNGFVYCHINGANTAGSAITAQFRINNKLVGTSGINLSTIVHYGTTFAVSAGDVVAINMVEENSNFIVGCYFIPPKFVAAPNPTIVVQPGGDYSLTEQPVMIYDNGTIRQKLDYNGKPIYTQTFTGNIVAAANVVVTTNIASGIREIISFSGFIQYGNDGNKLPLNQSYFVDPTVWASDIIKTASGGIVVSSRQSVARTGTTNNAYRVTVEYTKI